MRGYSQAVIEANEGAPPGLGATLGAVLITTRYPVSRAAKELAVSRQTVYDWISGNTIPSEPKEALINDLIEKLTAEE